MQAALIFSQPQRLLRPPGNDTPALGDHTHSTEEDILISRPARKHWEATICPNGCLNSEASLVKSTGHETRQQEAQPLQSNRKEKLVHCRDQRIVMTDCIGAAVANQTLANQLLQITERIRGRTQVGIKFSDAL